MEDCYVSPHQMLVLLFGSLEFELVEVVSAVDFVGVVFIVFGSTKVKQGFADASKDSMGSGPGRGK
jgi:hypothetical protein